MDAVVPKRLEFDSPGDCFLLDRQGCWEFGHPILSVNFAIDVRDDDDRKARPNFGFQFLQPL